MLAAAVPPGSFDIPAQDSPAAAWWRDSMETRDQRLAWWREARFGMFVHWGVYSHLGNEYRGRKGGGYAEHIQRVLKIPIPEYRAEVAGNFNPVGFDADAWIRQARDAGMGYFVITAKHHDGFAMWPSQVNRANVMDATPWRHDPMADLRAACRKYSVKFGFYYSHAFDWGEADGPGNDWDFKNPGGDTLLGGRDWWQTTPAFLPRAKCYVDEKSIPQLRELIAHYDPDILWFDTPHKLPPSENVRIMQAVRAASPRVVINGRIVRGWGDYDSTADRPAEFSPHEGDWEGIPTTNESYGWSKFDDSHKPPAHFIRLLAKAAARGGNLLMNIGPMGDGRFDPRDTAILSGIGTWWKLNGESIRGTERTPLPVQTWGESTRKGNRLYLHVFQWPADGRLVIGGLKSDVKSTRLLAGAPTRPLTTARLNALDMCIAVPAAAPDPVDAVVVVECAAAPVADTTRLLQPAFGAEALRAFDGELRGGLRFGAGKKTDDWAGNWTRADDQVAWSVRLNEPASYDVVINYDAAATSAGGAYTVSLGSQSLDGAVKSGNNQSVALGRVALQPGPFEIRVAAREIKGGELFRLRRVELRAAQAVAPTSARPRPTSEALVIEGLQGPVTPAEIAAFKAHMNAQTPPPTPWQGPGHNAWSFGPGGRNLEAMGLMFEVSEDPEILRQMIRWTDLCVSQRNDLLPADRGGQRAMWTGQIDKVWCPEAPTHKNARYAGCETEDAIAHIAYCAKLILQRPALWRVAVPDGDPFGYGATYLDRAKGYVARCDEANDDYFLKWFVQAGTNLIRDPANQPAWKAINNNVDSINRQMMFDGGYQRLAECHEILGDAPARVARYDAIVKASVTECLAGIKSFDPRVVDGVPVYNWHYFPWSADKTKSESVGHAAYDILGLHRASLRSAYGLTRADVVPLANTLVHVIAKSSEAFAATVDGQGPPANYLLGEWILCADWHPAVYELVARAAVTSGRYKNNANLTAHVLWMKQRRHVAAKTLP